MAVHVGIQSYTPTVRRVCFTGAYDAHGKSLGPFANAEPWYWYNYCVETALHYLISPASIIHSTLLGF